MITINVDPVLLYLGGHPVVRWYGLMYVVGILVGLGVALPYARAHGLTEDDVWAAFWPAVLAGLLGARLYYVAQSDPLSYLSQPWRILATWEGGMAFYGAVFGAALAIVVICHKRGINLWTFLDVAALFAVVGQAFGRVGNIINGDVVGYPTSLPWGFVYVHPNSFVPEKGIAYQPAALYELAFNLYSSSSSGGCVSGSRPRGCSSRPGSSATRLASSSSSSRGTTPYFFSDSSRLSSPHLSSSWPALPWSG